MEQEELITHTQEQIVSLQSNPEASTNVTALESTSGKTTDDQQGTSSDQQRDEEVHVIYLNVQDSDEPHVLDLSNLLVQEGIQVIDQQPSTVEQMVVDTHVTRSQDIVIENNSGTEITMIASQSEAQSVHALLSLSESQSEGGEVQVSDILAAHRQSEEQNTTSAEALLELSSDPTSGTYIVDGTGSMIPISQVSRSAGLLEVEDTGVTTIAICQCWCGREFISQEDLDRHKLAHRYQAQKQVTMESQKCTLCSESFATYRELRKHHTEAHPGRMPWECNVCHRAFQKKIAMKAHMRVHNIGTKYQCSSCKKLFYYKSALNRHLKMHSCEKPFKCTICGDMFHCLWDLRKHRMNHQPPKLFPCDICTKVFRQKQTLFVHSRIHTGQKPYSCETCHRNFSLKSTLVQHRRIHTGEKPSVCPICHRAFRQNSTLKAHIKTHTNLKPYMCRYCKMRFAYKDEVAEHEHVHARNKTWQCDECGMWFKNQSLLARHSRVHTNERPFQCTICNKKFVQSGSLQAHLRSHTKEKPYQCRMCSKAYYTSGTLLVHIRKFHHVDAKSVKEVFPVYNYIEDQKVFTIRNNLFSDVKPTVSVTEEFSESADKSDKTSLDGLLTKDNTLVEELVEITGEIVIPNSKASSEEITSTVADNDSEVHNVEITVGSETSISSSGKEENADNREQVMEQLKISDDDHPAMELDDNKSGDENLDAEAQDESSQTSHAAHDRQEAALGLAELSLIGGEGMQIEKPPNKTRTFYKEEEEDENDPNVTKIILSKEGGIMNSQDPHQCPVCGRIFGRKSIMIEHMRIHTNEKPYVCDFCKAGFRQNAQLRSHIRNKHTRVERYQCSFCHKRFLSRSITIRHINFHHKLKVKFCQNMDPAWTLDTAVWSDESFELNVSNPQFLKTGKRKESQLAAKEKIDEETNTDSGDGESQQQVTNSRTFVVKVPHRIRANSLSSEDQLEDVNSSENTKETTPQKESGTSGTDVVSTAVPSAAHEAKPIKPEEMNTGPSLHTLETVKVGDLSNPSAVVDSEKVSKALNFTTEVKTVSDSDFGGSRLLCATCAMQFRGVSSLRYHLRKVHNTTLAQSDVSFVYENGNEGEQNPELAGDEMSVNDRSLQNIGQVKINNMAKTTDDSETLKIVVYDDSHRCVDGPHIASMSYSCRMCTVRFGTKNDLEEHMKSHTEEEVEAAGLHRCDECASVMKNTQQVTKHILKFHGVKQIYVCSICQREFYQQSSVHRHMKFFHKWEIKIRGEASIPVYIKSPSSPVQGSSSTASVMRVRQDFTPHHKGQIVKSSNKEEENVTYISLEPGDMENVHIYRSDGQEVSYEIVTSNNKVRTLKIKEADASTETIRTRNKKKTVTILPTNAGTVDEGQDVSPATVSVVTKQTKGVVQADLASVTQVEATAEIKQEPLNSADSFTVLGGDNSAPLIVTKDIINQLVTVLRNSSSGNANEKISDALKVESLEHSESQLAEGASKQSGNNIQVGNYSTVKLDLHRNGNPVSSGEQSAVQIKVMPERISSGSKAPIVMSVKDIGAAFSGCGPRPGRKIDLDLSQQKSITTVGSVRSVVVEDALKREVYNSSNNQTQDTPQGKDMTAALETVVLVKGDLLEGEESIETVSGDVGSNVTVQYESDHNYKLRVETESDRSKTQISPRADYDVTSSGPVSSSMRKISVFGHSSTTTSLRGPKKTSESDKKIIESKSVSKAKKQRTDQKKSRNVPNEEPSSVLGKEFEKAVKAEKSAQSQKGKAGKSSRTKKSKNSSALPAGSMPTKQKSEKSQHFTHDHGQHPKQKSVPTQAVSIDDNGKTNKLPSSKVDKTEVTQSERRSSSGRLIKKKQFDDEIEGFSSPKRRKRH